MLFKCRGDFFESSFRLYANNRGVLSGTQSRGLFTTEHFGPVLRIKIASDLSNIRNSVSHAFIISFIVGLSYSNDVNRGAVVVAHPWGLSSLHLYPQVSGEEVSNRAWEYFSSRVTG